MCNRKKGGEKKFTAVTFKQELFFPPPLKILLKPRITLLKLITRH